MTRKLPHVGLNLPDAHERSMPEQEGLHWTTPAERDQQHRDAIFNALTNAIHRDLVRQPIHVVAEVGKAIPEVEGP